jgi:hypothetical protein
MSHLARARRARVPLFRVTRRAFVGSTRRRTYHDGDDELFPLRIERKVTGKVAASSSERDTATLYCYYIVIMYSCLCATRGTSAAQLSAAGQHACCLVRVRFYGQRTRNVPGRPILHLSRRARTPVPPSLR